jgi:hypothetical protein
MKNFKLFGRSDVHDVLACNFLAVLATGILNLDSNLDIHYMASQFLLFGQLHIMLRTKSPDVLLFFFMSFHLTVYSKKLSKFGVKVDDPSTSQDDIYRLMKQPYSTL